MKDTDDLRAEYRDRLKRVFPELTDEQRYNIEVMITHARLLGREEQAKELRAN